jgi:hypothetical protein
MGIGERSMKKAPKYDYCFSPSKRKNIYLFGVEFIDRNVGK